MRLLFLSNVFPNPIEPNKGTFNRELVRALSNAHEVQVVSPIAWVTELRAKRLRRSERRQIIEGVPAHYPRYYYPPKMLRGWYGKFFWWSIRPTVARVLRDHRPDAVIGYWAHPDGEAAVRAARSAGLPSIVMVGGSDVLVLAADTGRRKCILQVLKAADAVVTVSAHLRDMLVGLSIEAAKTHVVYRGVDLARFSKGSRDDARRGLGLPAGQKLALWVGRVVPVKGLDVLLDACSELARRGVAHHLYLVGDGPLRAQLETKAAALGLADSCTFVGPVAHDRLADWYQAADITVLPSRSEGIPNVLRESQACGTPFVASRVGGIPEIAEPVRDHLVNPGDPIALADAMQRAFGTSPPSTARRPSSWAESARELIDIVRERVKQTPVACMNPTAVAHPSRLRQFARASLSASLPRRYFLVRGRRRCRKISLTFDDGPHAEYTPKLLDALRTHQIKATFFLVGRNVERYPELARRIHAEGHVIGHHSFSHSRPETVSATDLLSEVRQTQGLFRDVLGTESRLFRPPRGKLTAPKLWRLITAGFRVILWNVDPMDYATDSTAEVRAWFSCRELRGGDLVVMHDTRPHAVEVLGDIASAASQRGLGFTTIDQWTS